MMCTTIKERYTSCSFLDLPEYLEFTRVMSITKFIYLENVWGQDLPYVKWNAIARKLETDRRGYATVNFNCAPAIIRAAIWRVQLPGYDPLSRFCSWHSRRCYGMVCWLVCTCVHVCVSFNSPPGQISLQTIIFLSLSSSIRHCESTQEKLKGSVIPGRGKQLPCPSFLQLKIAFFGFIIRCTKVRWLKEISIFTRFSFLRVKLDSFVFYTRRFLKNM